MVRIQNITSEPFQRHLVLLDEQEVTVVLRFLPTVQMWFIDVEYAGRSATGFKVSVSTLHMQSQNFPFDFVARDLSGRGLDPFKIDDFSDNRVALYMLESADMKEIRGQNVPI